MAISIDVIHADGTSESHTVEGAQITIGSSSEADVTIRNAAELAPLQLLVMRRPGGCWVASARDAKVQPSIKGKAFDNGMVPWGTELDVGSVSVRISDRDARRRPGALRSQKLLVAIGAALCAVVVLMTTGATTGMPTTNAAPPPLFDEVVVPCPDTALARRLYDEAIAEADAREGRYAYDSQEGIKAVARYREATACAALIPDEAAATAAREAGERLQGRVEGDFKTLRVALDRARSSKDLVRIGTMIKRVDRYISHRDGRYRSWLVALDHYVQGKLEAKNRGKKKKKVL